MLIQTLQIVEEIQGELNAVAAQLESLTQIVENDFATLFNQVANTECVSAFEYVQSQLQSLNTQVSVNSGSYVGRKEAKIWGGNGDLQGTDL